MDAGMTEPGRVTIPRSRIRFRHYAKSYIHIHVTGYGHPCQYDGASWSSWL